MKFETKGRTDGQTDAENRIWCICDIWWQRLYSICLYSATCKSVQHQCTQMTHRSLRAKLRL